MYSFYCIFDQMYAALVSIRDLFQKHQKSTNPQLLKSSLLKIKHYIPISIYNRCTILKTNDYL